MAEKADRKQAILMGGGAAIAVFLVLIVGLWVVMALRGPSKQDTAAAGAPQLEEQSSLVIILITRKA